MREFANLLSPIKVGTIQLNNRFIIPPMATNLANEDGTINQAMIDYWVTRARGGWGLLMLEFTAIDPLGKIGSCHPCIWSDKFIPGLRKLTEAVHQNGAKIAVQISHTGRQNTEWIRDIPGSRPVSASPIPCPLDKEIPRELPLPEVYELIEKYGDAGRRGRDAGFDIVEVHGAHGYLIAQFMSAYSNKRTDEFGGNFLNRMRFPLAIISNVRRKVGASFPLMFRMSGEERVPGGRTVDESRLVAQMVEKAGIDCIDVSVGVNGSGQYIFAPPAVPAGFLIPIVAEIKKAVSVPVVGVGRINNPYMAEDAIKSGKFDLVSIGRPSFADPELPNKVAAGQMDEICPCIYCSQGCLRTFPYPNKPPPKIGTTCLLNPFCGREGELQIKPASQRKKVTIVGGGPGGLEAAWIAAARGHQVTLLEKKPSLGGQFRIAAIPPFKQDIASAINYYIHMGKKYGVNFKLDTEADAKEILADKPDVVIIASGGEPLVPSIPGIDGPRVVNAWDVLEGKKPAGQRVLIAGGGMVGCEVADFLGEHLHNVTLVEMLPEIASDVPRPVKYFLMQRLKDYCVQVHTGATVVKFLEDGAIIKENGGKATLDGFDTIVLALGTKPVNNLQKPLGKKVPELYVIGDALAPRKAIEAIEEGARVALKI
jgi:2,4-dienoyl-CoA reductase-like NADH-dependent reductase (Old Yellow Enzyme family)/thioredoxin reductase